MKVVCAQTQKAVKLTSSFSWTGRANKQHNRIKTESVCQKRLMALAYRNETSCFSPKQSWIWINKPSMHPKRCSPQLHRSLRTPRRLHCRRAAQPAELCWLWSFCLLRKDCCGWSLGSKVLSTCNKDLLLVACYHISVLSLCEIFEIINLNARNWVSNTSSEF